MLKLALPHQIIGAQFLTGKKCAILADEMGLGKTFETILALQAVSKKQSGFALIVCPAIARRNWKEEFLKFWPERLVTVAESREEIRGYLTGDLIVSYEGAKHVLQDFGPKKWKALVLDEFHLVKNPETIRAKTILGDKGLCRRAHRIWALSGTPMPNHAAELWLITKVFGAHKMSYSKFVHTFCNSYGGKRRWDPLKITGTKKSAIPKLRRLLQPIMIRRLAKNVLDLPPIRTGDIYIPDDVKSQTIPNDLLQIEEIEQAKAQARQLGGVELTAEQLCLFAQSFTTLQRYNALMKVSHISELLWEELETRQYEKLIIFSCFTDVINGIYARLKRFHPVTLRGQDSNSKRQGNIRAFQNDPKCRVVVANILAAGTAINLTQASHVVFNDLSWVPGNNAQAVKRAHRMGNEHDSVYVRIAKVNQSIDERITSILARKITEIKSVLDTPN